MPRAVRQIKWDDLVPDEDGFRAVEMWGGAMVVREKADIVSRQEYGITHPIRVMKSCWKGRATYRRPASMVRKFEKGYNVFFVLAGEVTFHDATRSSRISKGCMGVQLPSRGYRIENWPDETGWVDLLYVRIPLHLFPTGVLNNSGFVCDLEDTPTAKIACGIAESLLDLGTEISTPTIERMADLVVKLIVEAASPRANDLKPRRTDTQFEKVCAFITDNLADPELSASLASEMLTIHPRTLSQIMRRNGTSFPDYVKSMRISLAKRFLEGDMHGALSISEISGRTGFRAAPQFNRAFREITAETPSEFRRRMHALQA